MNLKYIVIVVVLAVIVGGGILAYQFLLVPKEEPKMLEVKPPEVKAPEEVPPEEISVDETADWNVAQIGGWQIKYPPSPYRCGDSEAYLVCLSGDFSNDLSIWHGGNYITAVGGAMLCGKNYNDCTKGFPNSFTELEYERERTVGNIIGREFYGIRLGERKEKIFAFETYQRDGILVVRQTNFSPELDSIYEKMITTISPSD